MAKRVETRSGAFDPGPGLTRRALIKAAVWLGVLGVPSGTAWAQQSGDEDVPPEPDNLDEPTAWQEGDPEPYQSKVPAVEPEQSSQEAPPSQPMEDNAGDPPSDDAEWVSGYWWYQDSKYVWVPGYWAAPPQPGLVYIPGYWSYQSTSWVFVRGGWGQPNTTTVVAQPQPRPVLTALIITAPIRIVRRHRRWRHHHRRRARHRAHHANRRHHQRKRHNSPGGPGGGPGEPRRRR